MDNTDSSRKDPDKEPWFGPKRIGIGIRPTSWQGWTFLILALLIVAGIAFQAPKRYPAWFAAKTIGSGYTPATWQGWTISLVPVLLILVCIWYIYRKQNKP